MFRAIQAEHGGLFLGMASHLDRLVDDDPLALEETLHRMLADALQDNDVVLVDDLVLLGGHKAPYGKVLSLLAPRPRTGAYLVADDADACADYLRLVRAPDSGYLPVPFSEDVELTMKP